MKSYSPDSYTAKIIGSMVDDHDDRLEKHLLNGGTLHVPVSCFEDFARLFNIGWTAVLSEYSTEPVESPEGGFVIEISGYEDFLSALAEGYGPMTERLGISG